MQPARRVASSAGGAQADHLLRATARLLYGRALGKPGASAIARLQALPLLNTETESGQQHDLALRVPSLEKLESGTDLIQRECGCDRHFELTGGDERGKFCQHRGALDLATLRLHAVLLRSGKVDDRINSVSRD